MSFHISVAAKNDLQAALRLLVLQFQEHEIDVPNDQLRETVATMLADSRLGFILLAREGETAIGLACVSFCWTLEHGGKSAWLDELYVLPDFRGRGFGSALLDAALKGAQTGGCAAVDLEVDMRHAGAEQLYQQYGFQPLPRNRWVKSFAHTASES